MWEAYHRFLSLRIQSSRLQFLLVMTGLPHGQSSCIQNREKQLGKPKQRPTSLVLAVWPNGARLIGEAFCDGACSSKRCVPRTIIDGNQACPGHVELNRTPHCSRCAKSKNRDCSTPAQLMAKWNMDLADKYQPLQDLWGRSTRCRRLGRNRLSV